MLRSMAETNGLMVLQQAHGNLAGDEFDVMMFDGVL